jgi:predicted DsbA family dithiol-disulfide isomerase
VAAVRLYKLKDEFGHRLEFGVKAYPLRPGDRPSLPPVPGAMQGRMRAGAEARQDGLEFKPWPEGKPAPASSLPSLEAAKCAALQGEDAFRAYDLALFSAYFEECLDVADREVLLELARRTGLDIERFAGDLDSRSQQSLVMAEFLECLGTFGAYAQGVPLTSFNNSPPLVGCAPVDVYRTAILRQLEPLAR